MDTIPFTVLVVDDDESTLAILRAMLGLSGRDGRTVARVVAVGSLSEAKKAIASDTSFNAIVCDWDLGGGHTANDLLPLVKVPVVIVTAYPPAARRSLRNTRRSPICVVDKYDVSIPGLLYCAIAKAISAHCADEGSA